MSTISNERLEKLSEYDCADRYEVMSMATELLALRKEREQAEPAYYLNQIDYGDGEGFELRAYFRELDAMKSKDDFGGVVIPAYTAPPAPEFPAAYEINDDATDYHLGWNACRAVMLKSGNDDIGSWSNHKNTPTDKAKSEMSRKAEQLVRDTTALAEKLSAEADTTSQQLESLAGKAVGGWIPCGERMPEIGEEVLMRISCNDHFNIESGKYKGDGLWLGCWFSTYGKKGGPYQVTHWMLIPAAPEPCK